MDRNDLLSAAELWSRQEYFALANYLNNGNPGWQFAVSWVPEGESAQYKRNKSRRFGDSLLSSWDALSYSSRTPFATVVLPNLRDRWSRWWVFDLDAHTPTGGHHSSDYVRDLRAFIAAARAMESEEFFYLVEDSGRGWHCWLISSTAIKDQEWLQMALEFKRAVQFKMPFEEFPRFQGQATGVRLPGSCNPKTYCATDGSWSCSTIWDHNLPCLLKPPFTIEEKHLYSESKHERTAANRLLLRHAIRAPRSRHHQLAKFMGRAVYLLGKGVALDTAKLQWATASPQPVATLEEHMDEADSMYRGFLQANVISRFNHSELVAYNSLSPMQRDVFVIAWNFAKETSDGAFHFSGPRISQCIAKSIPAVYRARDEFVHTGIIEPLGDAYVTGKLAKRFRWRLRSGSRGFEAS
jgi:hypothetical protein